MDYEKKYKEEVDRTTQLWECGDITRENLEYIFPELKESEDEKVRKEIVRFIQMEVEDEIVGNKWLAWLGKQVEQKPVVIIPKFRIGDNIKTTNEEPLTITKIDDKGYWSEDLLICGFDDAAKWELVEQKPAWSEEDEAHIHSLLDRLNGMCKKGSTFITTRFAVNQDIDWLKSLRQRIEGE